MAFLSVKNVAIRGIAACVPPGVEENKDISFYTPEEVEQVIDYTGVERKHWVDPGVTACDLCLKACERLLDEIGWERDSIDAICNVTQTPDYLNHPNGFVMHEKLGLGPDCLVLDLFHGCPGWVVGLSTISSMMSNGQLKRVLFMDGDNVSSNMYKLDRESRPLFGDCGTATALEFDENAAPMYFQIGTNSSDGKTLIMTQGAYRKPFTAEEYAKLLAKKRGEMALEVDDSKMDGMSVFSFGISAPPKSVKKLCEHFGINLEDIDKLVLHQANMFMLKKIAKKLKIDMEMVPSSLKDYGNTTSASIPLTIVSQCAKEYSSGKIKSVCCGFGTGLAWASVYFETDKIVCPDVVIY